MQRQTPDLEPETQHLALKTQHLLGAATAAQALILPVLWNHTSDAGAVLGRYSVRYAAVLGLSAALLIGWLALFAARRRVIPWLEALPGRWRYGLIAAPGLAVFAVWLLPIEIAARETLAINWLLAALVLVRTGPDGTVNTRRWAWALAALLVAISLPMLITALTRIDFSPDEAHWADMATSPYVAGGLYSRTWQQEPVPILPGLGWSPAFYGWLLENVAFDIKVGRLWNIAAYLLAFAGIGAVTARLYGRRAGVIGAAFAFLSVSFIPILEYRPDHQLSAAGIWIVFAAVQARYVRRPAARAAWHFLAGLGATLSLELHAARIVFAFGLVLFYLAEFALNTCRQRRLPDWKPLLWFGLGAALGTGVYYVFNILPVGGIGPYLEYLIRTRGAALERFPFLRWGYAAYSNERLLLFESVPVWGGLAYLVWRRNQADRLYLGILACVLIGISLLETQGYRTTFNALYVVPIGALFVDGFAGAGFARGENRHGILAAACLIGVMAGQMAGTFIDWPTFGNWLRTHQLPPTLYEELRPLLAPHIRDDDVIVSTEQLIWTFPDHPHLIHFGAEYSGMQRWGLSEPVDVWERVQPTVIVFVEGHMNFDPGLQDYLERHPFEVCQQFEVQGHTVEVYREECATAG